MKGTKIFFMVIAVLSPSGLMARGLNHIIGNLRNLEDYRADAEVTVQLPQGSDVSYELTIRSTPAPEDSLSDARYLIEWRIPGNESSAGFTSYFDGNMYRFSDNRLTEYHFGWDSIPFLMGDRFSSAVQNNAQFIGYTPAKIAAELSSVAQGGDWRHTLTTDTLFNGSAADVIMAEYTRNGYLGKRVTLVLDPVTSAPVYYESENNPTSISEQVITVRFRDTSTEPFPVGNEGDLIALYPSQFEQFRESNFSVETLRNHPLPGFSLPTLTGERYTYGKGDSFNTPVIILFFDPEVATACETVSNIRKGTAMLPQGVTVIFVSNSTDIDGAEQAVGSTSHNEYLLLSGRSLARDCGVTSYPTILFADRNGIVRDVNIGFNNKLDEIVIEKMSVI